MPYRNGLYPVVRNATHVIVRLEGPKEMSKEGNEYLQACMVNNPYFQKKVEEFSKLNTQKLILKRAQSEKVNSPIPLRSPIALRYCTFVVLTFIFETKRTIQTLLWVASDRCYMV